MPQLTFQDDDSPDGHGPRLVIDYEQGDFVLHTEVDVDNPLQRFRVRMPDFGGGRHENEPLWHALARLFRVNFREQSDAVTSYLGEPLTDDPGEMKVTIGYEDAVPKQRKQTMSSSKPTPEAVTSSINCLSADVSQALRYLAEAQLVYEAASRAKANLPTYDSTTVGEHARNLYKDLYADAEEALAKATVSLAQAARLVSELATDLGRCYATRLRGNP
jgi:hypothetical protein